MENTNGVVDKEAGLYEALRTVIDPEIGMNIIEAGACARRGL